MVKAQAVIRSEEARATAAAQFVKAKQDDEAKWQERARLREVEAEKIARLRDLRLAKEAAERAAAALPKPPAPPRKRVVASPAAKSKSAAA